MDKKRLEIVSVVERRRKWPPEEKARIMEEALAPGATVAGVAGRTRFQTIRSTACTSSCA